jgi:hypothetical protein
VAGEEIKRKENKGRGKEKRGEILGVMGDC